MNRTLARAVAANKSMKPRKKPTREAILRSRPGRGCRTAPCGPKPSPPGSTGSGRPWRRRAAPEPGRSCGVFVFLFFRRSKRLRRQLKFDEKKGILRIEMFGIRFYYYWFCCYRCCCSRFRRVARYRDRLPPSLAVEGREFGRGCVRKTKRLGVAGVFIEDEGDDLSASGGQDRNKKYCYHGAHLYLLPVIFFSRVM